MMKIGIFLDHLREASKQSGRKLDDVARMAFDAGIRFVHINGSFWTENEKRVDELLERTGLCAGSSDDVFALTQGKDQARAENLIRFLSRKGVKQLLLIPGFVHEAQSRQSAMDEAARHMRELMYLARCMHVQCSLEDYDNAAAPFGTWQELKWYTEKVPDLKITFDTGNFAFFGQDAMNAYHELKSEICMVHAKDRKRTGRPGEKAVRALDGTLLYPSAVGAGEMPMQEILNDLHESGYRGGVLIEHFDSADMIADLLDSAAFLRQWSE